MFIDVVYLGQFGSSGDPKHLSIGTQKSGMIKRKWVMFLTSVNSPTVTEGPHVGPQ